MADPAFTTAVSAGQAQGLILERLTADGVVEPAALARAQLIARRNGQAVEQVLNQIGALSDDGLANLYADVCGCPVWNPALDPVELDWRELGVTEDFLRRGAILPLRVVEGELHCAAQNPLDREAVTGLSFAAGLPVALAAARPRDWRRAWDELFSRPQTEAAADERRLAREIDQVSDSGAQGAGARVEASAFEAAIAAGASDIHFEPRRHDLLIRLRIDGRLIEHQAVSADLAAPAVSRIKVIANLDLGEKRLPQDGRTTFVIGGRQVDVRVATSPTVFGEAAVLRLLDRTAVPLDLPALGLSEPVTRMLRQAVRSPHGLFLVTGPTGSGKTTTLYALLQMFAGSAKKVLSVEDPVEFHFDHVAQTQVAPQIGLSFAAALRSFLRQDPDVILVGEIRDPETAAVAIQAAMTGHFVLASVHANDAVSVVPRLRDMGVEPFQLAAGFRGAAAQRLVRRLCPDCRRPRDMTAGEQLFVEDLGLTAGQTFDPNGCPACHHQGYRGRTAIAETYLAGEAMARLIAEGAAGDRIANLALQGGMTPMALDGARKAAAGETTLEEVMAAVYG